MSVTYLSREKKFFCAVFRKRLYSANLSASPGQSVTSSHAKGLRGMPIFTICRDGKRTQMHVDFTPVIK